jgi:hypothetical protein
MYFCRSVQRPTSLPKAAVSQPAYGISLADPFVRQPPTQIANQLKAIKQLGFSSVRFTISWYVVQPHDAKSYDWKLYDRTVEAASHAGLKSLVIINYTPAWARLPACARSAYCAPARPTAFATFAAAAAKRYSTQGVHSYEIWNEENIHSFWQPTPSPEAYVSLLKAAYPAIKKADPYATVVLGSMSGVSVASSGYMEPRDYLAGLYKNGIQPYFDALGYHAYTFPELPDEFDSGKNAWAKISTATPSLRSIMQSHGDVRKKIWITEVGAPTNGPGSSVDSSAERTRTTDHVSQDLQAKIAKQVLYNSTHTPGIGALYWYTYQDKGARTDSSENFYGLLANNGTPKSSLQVVENFLKSKQ